MFHLLQLLHLYNFKNITMYLRFKSYLKDMSLFSAALFGLSLGSYLSYAIFFGCAVIRDIHESYGQAIAQGIYSLLGLIFPICYISWIVYKAHKSCTYNVKHNTLYTHIKNDKYFILCKLLDGNFLAQKGCQITCNHINITYEIISKNFNKVLTIIVCSDKFHKSTYRHCLKLIISISIIVALLSILFLFVLFIVRGLSGQSWNTIMSTCKNIQNII